MPTFDQPVRDMRTNKTGCPGDEYVHGWRLSNWNKGRGYTVRGREGFCCQAEKCVYIRRRSFTRSRPKTPSPPETDGLSASSPDRTHSIILIEEIVS